MENEGLDKWEDEWDADFVDELVQVEEHHLLATQNPPPKIADVSYSPPPPPPKIADVSYSPPRELSQRVPETKSTGDRFDSFAPPVPHFTKEEEMAKLEKELSRVSKQLNKMERECLKLKMERDKKEEELKVVHLKIEARDTESQRAKSNESYASSPADPGISPACQNAISFKRSLAPVHSVACSTVGVQTDKIIERCHGSKKLLNLWNSSDQELRKGLAEKLLSACEADFHVLFGYLNSSSHKTNTSYRSNESDMALSNRLHPSQPVESAKVTQLYSVLMKVSDGTSRLEDMFKALVDLCSLKNVDIVHRSLHVLHIILVNSFTMEKKFGKRTNVMIEDSASYNNKSEINGYGYPETEKPFFANVAKMLNKSDISHGIKLANMETPGYSGNLDLDFAASISGAYWVSLFEYMCQITITYNKEEIRREALSIMNLILMRQNAYSEREKFAGELLFQSLSQLLRRGSGYYVQDLAVHTLYLLCNCPKVIAMLCSGYNEDVEHTSDANQKRILDSQGLNEILIGLADCVASSGSAITEEMELRKNAILFLAFLGSSGNFGLEILLNPRLPKDTNFLAIILQSLVSDLDLNILKSSQLSDVGREQRLVIREALILLNRLVSHPQYSVTVLKALTNTRDMASMTVDIANRLTNKNMFSCQDDKMRKQVRDTEIMELAWVFRKKVYMFLGDSIS